MTDNDQEKDLPTPGGADPDPTPEAAKSTTPDPIKSGRFSVYDNRIRQFRGGVVDKRPTKAEAKRTVGHDDYEIREV